MSTPSTPPSWTPLTRLAFRFTFAFFMLYALANGNATVWEILPFGLRLEGWAARPFDHAAQFLAQNILHLTGNAAHLHPSGYGDRLLDWLAAAIILAAAILIAALWTLLDHGNTGRHRTEYTTLFLWLRFTLRLSLAVGMFIYGCMKLYPFQVPPPSLAVLNEPVGHLSPLTLLWTTLGFSPLYERLTGCIEILSALLLVFRRTALAGTLVAIVVLANICLFDFFFDVPVKLYASMLLLMALVMLAPDARALIRFFFTRQPAAANTPWTPLSTNVRLRRTVLVLEALTLIHGCITLPLRDHAKYTRYAAALRNPSPLTGEWNIDASTLNGQPHPFLAFNGQPLTAIFLEPNARVTGRAADGTLWSGTLYDPAAHTLQLMNQHHIPSAFTFTQPDPTHLLLTPTNPTEPTLTLSRVSIPTSYPLYERGFHLTNEWGYER